MFQAALTVHDIDADSAIGMCSSIITDDRSRNEGMCAPFVKGDEVYRTRGTWTSVTSGATQCEVILTSTC